MGRAQPDYMGNTGRVYREHRQVTWSGTQAGYMGVGRDMLHGNAYRLPWGNYRQLTRGQI